MIHMSPESMFMGAIMKVLEAFDACLLYIMKHHGAWTRPLTCATCNAPKKEKPINCNNYDAIQYCIHKNELWVCLVSS